MKYIMLSLILSFSIGARIQAQLDSSKLASLYNIILSDADREAEPFLNTLREFEDFSSYNESILNLIHTSLVGENKNILTTREYRIYRKINFAVSKTSEKDFTIVKSDENKKELIFNENFLSRLMNYCYLNVVSEVNYDNRENFAELYSEALQYIPLHTMQEDLLSLKMDSRSSQMHNAIIFDAIMKFTINIVFIEMHELYHLCYGNSHENASIEEEMAADKFAILKIKNYLDQNYTNPIYDKYPSLKVGPLSIEDELIGFSSIGILFQYMRERYDTKAHIFENTINQISYRGYRVYREIFNISCIGNENKEGCIEFNREIPDHITIDMIEPMSNEHRNQMLQTDQFTFSDVVKSKNYFEIARKIRYLLFDENYEEAQSSLEWYLFNSNIEIDEVFREYYTIIYIHLLQYSEEYNLIPETIDKNIITPKILPLDYYETLKRKYDYDMIYSHNSFFSNQFELFKNDIKSAISNNITSTQINQMIPYSARLTPFNEKIIGKWYGETVEDKFGNLNAIGEGVFEIESDFYIYKFKGEINSGLFNNYGEIWTTFAEDGVRKEIYLHTNFVDGEALGSSYIRILPDSISVFANVIDGKVIGPMLMWLKDENFAIFECKECYFFEGNMRSFTHIDEGQLQKKLFQFAAEYYRLGNKANYVFDCMVEGNIIPFLYSKDFLSLVDKYILSKIENGNTNFSVKNIFEEIERQEFPLNPAFAYGLSSLINCLNN